MAAGSSLTPATQPARRAQPTATGAGGGSSGHGGGGVNGPSQRVAAAPPSMVAAPVAELMTNAGGSPPGAAAQAAFSRVQLQVLRMQILAFRRLKRGDRVLPNDLLQAISPPPLSSPAPQPAAPSAAAGTSAASPAVSLATGALASAVPRSAIRAAAPPSSMQPTASAASHQPSAPQAPVKRHTQDGAAIAGEAAPMSGYPASHGSTATVRPPPPVIRPLGYDGRTPAERKAAREEEKNRKRRELRKARAAQERAEREARHAASLAAIASHSSTGVGGNRALAEQARMASSTAVASASSLTPPPTAAAAGLPAATAVSSVAATATAVPPVGAKVGPTLAQLVPKQEAGATAEAAGTASAAMTPNLACGYSGPLFESCGQRKPSWITECAPSGVTSGSWSGGSGAQAAAVAKSLGGLAEAVPLAYDARELLRDAATRHVERRRVKALAGLDALLDQREPAGSGGSDWSSGGAGAEAAAWTRRRSGAALARLWGLSEGQVVLLRMHQRMLRLLDMQAKIREEVEEEQLEVMKMGERAYRTFVRWGDRQRLEIAKQHLLNQKMARERHCKAVLAWRKKFYEQLRVAGDMREVRNKQGVAKHHERMLREAAKKKDEDRLRRMEALKNNDVDTYREMLLQQQTAMPSGARERFEVLSSFLTQTEDYLKKLGSKISAVKVQQEAEECALSAASAARAQGMSDEEVAESARQAAVDFARTHSSGDAQPDKGAKGHNKYYSMAHSINEQILRQPSMLQAGTLRDYQLVGLQWMLSLYNNRLNGILADEMGLGKTVQVMALMAYLMEFKANYGPHLIIVPNAVMVNWKSELLRWLPTVSCIFYVGSKEQRAQLFAREVLMGKFNVLVTTYEFIMRDRTKLSRVDWRYIIIDEAQRMKDRDSRLARDLDRFRCVRRLLLTGTPLQNDLGELWSLLNLLLPEVFDNSRSFHDWFATPFHGKEGAGEGGDEDDWLETEKKVIVIHRLHQILEPFMLRRRVEDVEGSLPPKISVVVKCRMSAYQAAVYDWVKATNTIRLDPADEANRIAAGGSKRSARAFAPLQNKCMELRKVCNHPYLSYAPRAAGVDDEVVRSCGKLFVLDRALVKLHATGHRVLLFSTMTRLLDILEEYLRWRGFQYRRIDGTTSLDAREVAINDFNAVGSTVFIFLLSIRAAGRGLNLQTADTVVVYDPDPNPKNEEQAVARAHRIGQKREVRVLYLEAVVEMEPSYLKEVHLSKRAAARDQLEVRPRDKKEGRLEGWEREEREKKRRRELLRRRTAEEEAAEDGGWGREDEDVDDADEEGAVLRLREGGAKDRADKYMGSIETLVRNNIQQHKIDMADEVINAGRFDQRTTQEERRLTLEALLHDEERYQHAEHDVPSFADLNRMIARGDDEVALFDKMDEEWEWPGELLTLKEVPRWLRAGPAEVARAAATTSKVSLRRKAAPTDLHTDNAAIDGLALGRGARTSNRQLMDLAASASVEVVVAEESESKEDVAEDPLEIDGEVGELEAEAEAEEEVRPQRDEADEEEELFGEEEDVWRAAALEGEQEEEEEAAAAANQRGLEVDEEDDDAEEGGANALTPTRALDVPTPSLLPGKAATGADDDEYGGLLDWEENDSRNGSVDKWAGITESVPLKVKVKLKRCHFSTTSVAAPLDNDNDGRASSGSGPLEDLEEGEICEDEGETVPQDAGDSSPRWPSGRPAQDGDGSPVDREGVTRGGALSPLTTSPVTKKRRHHHHHRHYHHKDERRCRNGEPSDWPSPAVAADGPGALPENGGRDQEEGWSNMTRPHDGGRGDDADGCCGGDKDRGQLHHSNDKKRKRSHRHHHIVKPDSGKQQREKDGGGAAQGGSELLAMRCVVVKGFTKEKPLSPPSLPLQQQQLEGSSSLDGSAGGGVPIAPAHPKDFHVHKKKRALRDKEREGPPSPLASGRPSPPPPSQQAREAVAGDQLKLFLQPLRDKVVVNVLRPDAEPLVTDGAVGDDGVAAIFINAKKSQSDLGKCKGWPA
eukprot:SM000100S09425  [mRNA]  locus=s100:293798:302108:+ [translate_table: standard]